LQAALSESITISQLILNKINISKFKLPSAVTLGWAYDERNLKILELPLYRSAENFTFIGASCCPCWATNSKLGQI